VQGGQAGGHDRLKETIPGYRLLVPTFRKPHLSPASGPYDFSPATTAALLALVASKADNGVFAVSIQPTNVRFTGYGDSAQYAKPGQCRPPGLSPSLALLLQPASPATARLYSATVIYRGRTQPFALCADQAKDVYVSNILAQQALEWMNGLDLLYPVNRAPNPVPDVAGLALNPQGQIIGSLLGYAGPKVTNGD
jgi:hypothetical protein